MRLSYRGHDYDYHPMPSEMVESEMSGTYRGREFKFSYPRHIPVPQPIKELQYRGVNYRTTTTGVVETLPIARLEEKLPANLKPFVCPRRESLADVAQVHRLNIERRLRHRLEVAQAKGDAALIHQLESEMQQLA